MFFSHLEQLETSIVGPSQFLPPQRGAGLSHDLERHKQELTPSTPSSLLQGCHGAQGPKLPLVVWFRSWKTTISRGENEVSLVNINQVWSCDFFYSARGMTSLSPDKWWCSASTGSCWSCPPVWCIDAAWSPSHSRGPSPPSTVCTGTGGRRGRRVVSSAYLGARWNILT